MTCWKKKTKNAEKRYKQKKVHPLPEFNQGFVDQFVKEVIYCGGCKQPFNLQSNELKIHCNLCNQFFHCKIAGPCLGENCSSNINGVIHRARYCYNCVGKVYDGGTCLCKDCLNDETE